MKKFYKVLFVVYLLFCVQQLSAQRTQIYKQFGGRGEDKVNGFIRDYDGNFIAWGTYQDVLQLGAFEFKTNEIRSFSFVARFDTLGNVLWAKSYDCPSIKYCSIGLDSNIYVVTTNFTDNYYQKTFYVKIDIQKGEELWKHVLYAFDGDNNSFIMDDKLNIYASRGVFKLDDFSFDEYSLEHRFIKFNNDGTYKISKGFSTSAWYRVLNVKNNLVVSELISQDNSEIAIYRDDLENFYFAGFSVPNLYEKTSISKDHKVSVLCDISNSVKIDGTAYFPYGDQDVILMQFNEFAKVEWKIQLGGKGGEDVFKNEYNDDGTLTVGIYTGSGFTIDTLKVGVGKNLLTFDQTGKCLKVVPYTESIVETSTIYIYGKRVPIQSNGTGYTFGNLQNDYYDTIVAKGMSDFYFAKVSCLPAFIKRIYVDTSVCKNAPKSFSVDLAPPFTTFKWETDRHTTIETVVSWTDITFDTIGIHQITVTPINSCGVGEPFSIKVKVKDKPGAVSLIQGNSDVCLGTSNYKVDSIASGKIHWSLDRGFWDQNLVSNKNKASITFNWPGIYILKASEYNECGDGVVSTKEIKVLDLPERPTIIEGNDTVCKGEHLYNVATQANTKYQWFLNGGGDLTGTENMAKINWQTPGKHTLLVTAENICGVSLPQTKTIFVNDVPDHPAPIRGEIKTCLGRNIYYTDKIDLIKYQWDISGGGLVSWNDNYAEINWTIPGTFTVKVTQANECGAGAPSSLVVKVLDVPTAIDSIIGLEKVCQGQQLYAVAQRADEEYKWDLTAGGSLLPKGNTASIGWSAAGAYTLSVSPFNQCGTGRSVSKIVTVSSATSQVGAIVGKEMPCLSTETYTVNSVAGLSYAWKLDGGGALTQNANNATVVWNKTGVHSVQLTTSDNCSVSLIAQVIDKPLAPNSIVGNAMVCLSEASYQVEAEPLVQYRWTLSDGGKLTPYNNAASVVWEKAGMYELQVLAYNQCGTSDVSKMQVKTLQAPQTPSLITGNDTVCISSESYTIGAQTDVTYNWWLNNAGGILTSNNNTADVAWQYAHENVLNVSVNNMCGTSAIRSLPVVVKSKPSTAVLLGDSLACTGVSVYYVHPQSETQYIWGVLSGGTLTPKLDSARVQWTSTGNHIISVTPKNFCGLGQASLRTIAVNSTPSLSETIAGKDVACQGMEFYSVTGRAGLQYAWSVTSGGSLVSLGNSAKIFWTGAGVQTVSLTPYNECGLGKSVQKTVNVKRIPDSASIIVGLRKACFGTQTYSVTAVDAVNYSWSLPSGGTIAANKNTASIDWQTKGFHSIMLVPSNMCGAGPAQNITVQVLAMPTKPQFASADTLVCAGRVCRLQINELENNTYNWSLASASAGTIAANADQANIVFKNTGLQTVRLTASNFCGTSEVAEQNIRVQTVPSIVTPITGRTTLCLGKAMYHILNSNKNTLTWNINGGGSLSPQGDSAQVDWFTAGQYKISVTPSNECGNGNTQTLVVQTVTKPQQPDAIQGVNTLCLHAAAQLSTSAKTDVSYIWLTDTSGTITSTTNTASVVYRQGGAHTISLIPSNSCGQGPATTASVQVNEPPRTMIAVFGDSSLCINSNANYAVPLEQGVSYIWNISNNGVLSSNNNTATFTANKVGDFKIDVQIKNQCGTVSLPVKTIRVKTVPSAKLNIIGDSSTCLGNTQYRVANNGNSTLWNINGGGAIESKQNMALVNWNSPGVYQISAQENNLCGSGQLATKSVTVIGAPALPVDIQGEIAVCAGTKTHYHSLLLPDIEYQWQVVGQTADTAFKAQHSNTADITFVEPGTAQLSVHSFNRCGQSQSRYLSIKVESPLLKVPFAILGDSVLCINSTATYSTSLVNDFDWHWTIDSALTRGTFKNSAQVEWTKAGKFMLVATPYNTCGTGNTAYFGVQVEVPLQKPVIEYRGDSLVVVTTDSITWYKNMDFLGGVPRNVIPHPISGQYMVQTHNTCGSSPYSDSSYIVTPSFFSLGMRLYPNPSANDYIVVELPLNYEWENFNLLDSKGCVISTYQNKGNNRIVLALEGLSRGSYIIWVNGKPHNISGHFEKL